MNAIDFLLKEHQKVRNTFEKINKLQNQNNKMKMLSSLCEMLLVHETMEQQVWYPHFRNSEKLDTKVKHLVSEEKHAEKVIQNFLKNVKTEKDWNKKFLKFRSDVEHHANEEETKLFPNVEKILNEAELKKIAVDMKKFKSHFNVK